MKPANLKDALGLSLFRSFEIHYLDKVIPVNHPEQVSFSPAEATAVVWSPDGHLHILDLAHVAAIRLRPRPRGNASTARRA